MGDEIKELKSVLRSLVVSSPTQMDVQRLMRDYRNMMGAPVPLNKYGHRNPVDFLKERFSDCFLFAGPPSNPVLTLIVPDTLKHIDQFVQRQKVPSTAKFKLKRRSIPETIVNPPKQNLIYQSYTKHTPPITEEPKKPEVKPPDITIDTNQNKENVDNHHDSTDALKNFLKKRLPMYNSSHNIEGAPSDKDGTMSMSQDDDSGKHTSSSSNSTKALQFEELKSEIMELITSAAQGVWCTDLIRLYRERYKRELNFTRFGYTSIISLVYVLEASVQITRPVDTGDWLLQERRRAAPAPPTLHVPRARRHLPTRHALHAPDADPDDALPGIDFDPDVFPEDCMHFMESIPSMPLSDCRPGAMLEVIVGEVYSPSHFWIIRLGENYNIAMEDIMDDMTRYYNGPGRTRGLARGAIRVGHYCSTLYDNDWHRSLIVKIVDSDTVKVRHVDYGTVDTVGVQALRPLRREWAALPAQAVRARLAALRPSAAGRRWPHAAAAHFLRLVRDTRLVANIVAVDQEESVIETLLIDTSGAEDMCVSGELIRAGHADARPDSALRTAECYLYPRFEALESGDTPNYGEIHAYLRDGIALDYVEAYRQHVPLCLPADTPARPASAPPPPAEADAALDDTYDESVSPDSSAEPSDPSELATRIPLMWPGASEPVPAATSPISATSRSIPSPSPAPSPPPAPARPASPAAPLRVSPSAGVPVPPSPVVCAQPALFHPPAMYPLPPIYPPPPGAHPSGQWFGPYPAPGAGAYVSSAPLGVTLSRVECETYRMLAHVNPAAAHWYMAGALGRAMGGPAPHVRPGGPPYGPPHGPPHGPPRGPPHGMRPPPGFGA